MDAELAGIRPLRRRLGLTQHQLAQAARVSQSLVAKVEAGLVDPSFSAGKRILDALRSMERRQEPRAKELMQARITTVRPDDSVRNAVRKMRSHGYSQLPVLDGASVAGLLTERCIVAHMDALGKGSLVREVMEEAPPIVPPEAPRKALAELLAHYSLVLVQEKGKVRGIVTKADLLNAV